MTPHFALSIFLLALLLASFTGLLLTRALP